jgi:hypothetical protein
MIDDSTSQMFRNQHGSRNYTVDHSGKVCIEINTQIMTASTENKSNSKNSVSLTFIDPFALHRTSSY